MYLPLFMIARCQKRLSDLPRGCIDIRVEAPPVADEKLTSQQESERLVGVRVIPYN